VITGGGVAGVSAKAGVVSRRSSIILLFAKVKSSMQVPFFAFQFKKSSIKKIFN
jgi:hypothetical protein